MTATYQKRGLEFLYPENWKLIDDAEAELPSAISLETPDGSAFWSVHLYPPDDRAEEILKNTIQTLQETYPDLEVSECRGDFESRQGTAIETMFYCLDFLIRVRLQVVATADYQLMFWFQAEDREFDNQELVFQALATSVLRK